jgi:hypothetical protein
MNMRHFNFPTEADIATLEHDARGLWTGLVNLIIPSLFGWLLLLGMFYVGWCLLPGGL